MQPSLQQQQLSRSTIGSTQLSAVDDADEVTKKFGLEAGLFSIFKSGANKEGKAVQAKDLLAKYGSAYLATSISLSIVSFSLCYALVTAGVDVPSLLAKVGITASSQTETAGTVALAYAAHKAASPIRFPPTVALTPFVANAFGKKPAAEDAEE
ncbi:protein fam210b-like [Nannochloropsis oceanica]